MRSAYFEALDHLVSEGRVVLDGPRGEPHPHHPGVVYPLDHGHLARGTRRPIAVLVGTTAGAGLTAAAVTVDLGERDTEMTLLLDCSPAEIAAAERFLTDGLGLATLLLFG